jgi:hypothetical protein
LHGYEQILFKWWPEIMAHAGPKAGILHYRVLATHSLHKLSGWPGFIHYTALGALRTSRNRLLRILYEIQRQWVASLRRLVKRKR